MFLLLINSKLNILLSFMICSASDQLTCLEIPTNTIDFLPSYSIRNIFGIILVPILQHDSLDTTCLYNGESRIVECNLANDLIPRELKKKIKFTGDVVVFKPPKDFKDSDYLEFYLFLTENSFYIKIFYNYCEIILYYLNYFSCKDKILLFKLFKKIIRSSRNVNHQLQGFFSELNKLQNLKQLFNVESDQDLTDSFKESYYDNELEQVLVPDTYLISINETTDSLEISLKNKDSDQNKSFTKIAKLDKNNSVQFKIIVYSNVLEAAVIKVKDDMIRRNKELLDIDIISIETASKIYESLEFLVTKHKLSAESCSNGVLYFFKEGGEKLHLLNSFAKCFFLVSGYEYPCRVKKIYMKSEICTSKEVISLLDCLTNVEVIFDSECCEIEDIVDLEIIHKYFNKTKVTRNENITKLKLVIQAQDYDNHIDTIFVKVKFSGTASVEEVKDKYHSLKLNIFLGPLDFN